MATTRLKHVKHGYLNVYNDDDLQKHISLGWEIDVPIVKPVETKPVEATKPKQVFKVEKHVKHGTI